MLNVHCTPRVALQLLVRILKHTHCSAQYIEAAAHFYTAASPFLTRHAQIASCQSFLAHLVDGLIMMPVLEKVV
jgi:hypothetical protein